MVDRLTRRERAAMQLALECLRGSVPVRVTGRLRSSPDFREGRSHCFDGVMPALRIGDPGLSGLWLDLGEALADRDTPRRLIRARLALYLRARLRADGREEIGFGRWACVACGSDDLRHPWVEPGPRCRSCGGNAIEYTCRITPLWELAPAHEVE